PSEEDPNINWCILKSALLDAASTTLAKPTTKKKKWISEETFSLILTSMEAHLSESDERLLAAEVRIVVLTSTVADLRDQIDDQENRTCRNNIRILGFPEGVEQEALPTLLKLPIRTDLSIERAHRSLVPYPGPGQRPRPFVIKLLRFPVKELLLRSARELGMLEWEGHKILLFPDLSRALQDRRRQFLSVKKILHDKMIKYGMFYPATLWVTYKG
uniref:L1 transposable element RRM domain-containing protein n=1 Tax=Latimeria chalumnae TaxID=7897 RepID=H3A5X4_LATCH